MSACLWRHHPGVRRESRPIVKLDTLSEVNVERRRAAAGDRGHRHRQRRAAPCESQGYRRRSAECRSRKTIAHGQERHDRGRRQETVSQRLRADRKTRHHRRGSYQPGAGAAGAFAGLRRDGGRSAYRVRQPRAVSGCAADAEWPDVALPPLNVDHYTAFVAVTHDPRSTIRRCCTPSSATASISARWARERPTPNAAIGSRRKAQRMPISRAFTRRSVSTSARCRHRKSRSRSWPRSPRNLRLPREHAA